VAFNLAGRDPIGVAEALNRAGVEARAGCHCATLAHHALRLSPPASCRLSFYLYNTPGEVDRAVAAVADVAAGQRAPAPPWYRFRRREPGPRPVRRATPRAASAGLPC
jgi:cysteine desulfurase/selenocysteine lyase